MPAERRFPASARAVLAATAAIVVAALPLGACTQPRTTCGEPSPAGGPPVITTKDGELCESARLRVAEALARLPTLVPEDAERYRDMTWSWEDARTLDAFMRRVRDDAGEEIAAAMSLAIEQVRAHSTKPTRADCKSEERCLVKGAALGARIAFDDAAGILLMMRRARSGLQHDPPSAP
jgi:hypothetical protein